MILQPISTLKYVLENVLGMKLTMNRIGFIFDQHNLILVFSASVFTIPKAHVLMVDETGAPGYKTSQAWVEYAKSKKYIEVYQHLLHMTCLCHLVFVNVRLF